MDKKPKILVVEDEEAIRQGLIDVFVYHGYEVEFAVDGQTGLDMALKGGYDIILLDVMLPKIDGFQVCDKIRTESREQPIIMLTAKTSEEDIITGLSSGADDYIAKPFSVRELVLRVEAVLRRSKSIAKSYRTLSICEGIEIDTATLEGKDSAGNNVMFTRKEVNIIQYLLSNSDRPVSREELLEEVWGYEKASKIETRTVDIHIAKLRRKIESDPKEPKFLVTLRGEGYRLL